MFCLIIEAHCFTNLTYKHCSKPLCIYNILIYTLYTLLTSQLEANTRKLILKMCTKPGLLLSLRWVGGVVRWIWGGCQIIWKRSKMFVLEVKVLLDSLWWQLQSSVMFLCAASTPISHSRRSSCSCCKWRRSSGVSPRHRTGWRWRWHCLLSRTAAP